MKRETEKLGVLASRISTLSSLIGIEDAGKSYFSVEYLKTWLNLKKNEIRMIRIGNIFYNG